MTKHILLNRTATLAIVATVAILPTPLFAQDAPAAEAPVETLSTAEPVAAEPSVAPETSAAPAEPVVEVEAAPTAPVAKPRVKNQAKAHAPVANPAPARAETVAVAPEPNPLAASTIVSPLNQPIAEPTAETVEPAMAMPSDELERAAFAGILALLALGGAATAVSRRRRAHAVPECPEVHDVDRASIPHSVSGDRDPVRHAPSAFAWGRTDPAVSAVVDAGGSWAERARRGPSPDNPSLSLKKRLKRAAFFEQRERAVAAGRAIPVDPFAGLPAQATKRVERRWIPQPVFTHAFQAA